MRVAVIIAELVVFATAEHHMKRRIVPRQNDNGGGGGSSSSSKSPGIIVTNQCKETIWPGLVTQGGKAPTAQGFALSPGASRTVEIAGDWQGRVWGRTNCSFSNGQNQGQCTTGECGQLDCKQAGNPPATLAEFTMAGSQDQAFYDISLVDGYNLPMAIVLDPEGIDALKNIQAKSTNPSCIGTASNLAPQGFNPYINNQQFLGTTSSSPMDFDTKNTASSVANWCPWDLQLNPPTSPSNGVYPYPDGNVQRPSFGPCLSACKKYNKPEYCCTGQYGPVGSCSPDYYAKAAKAVCPDAYSFAQDDQSSTFIVPMGGAFQVIFCPGGRSTNIIASHDK